VKNISEIIKNRTFVKDTHNTHEFQAYGNRLAEEFNDRKHRSLYIKLAKTEDRDLLEKAREFVMRSENATTKGKLFMWKLHELKKILKDSTI
jgi:hypothetical protein